MQPIMICLFCFVLSTRPVHAQSDQLKDSLLKKLPHSAVDTNKVLLLLAIAKEYQVSSLETARKYVDEAMQLSKQLNYPAGVMKSYRFHSYIYAYQSKFDSLEFASRKVIDIAKQQKDSFNLGAAYFNIGTAKRFLHELDSAIQYMREGVRLLEGKGYISIESALYDGLQSLYMTLTQYDKAIMYGEKSVQIARQNNSMEDLSTSLNNLGLSYVETGRLPEAKRVYKEGLEVARKIGYAQVEAMLLNNLSDIHLREGKFAEAYVNSNAVLEIQKNAQDSTTLMNTYQVLANYFLSEKNYEKASQYARDVIEISDKIELPDGKSSGLGLLARIAFAQHKFAEGIQYQFQQHKVDEQIFNESVKQKEASWRVRFETEKKDAQLQLQSATLDKRKTWNIILGGTVGFIMLLSLLSYRNYRTRQNLQQQRITELETEKQLAATEAVLKGEEQERSRMAKDLHDGLGGMLSGIKYSLSNMKQNLIMTPDNAQAFERSIDMLDTSIKEMRRVAHNMMPEALLKFGLDEALKDFCNDVHNSGVIKVNYQSIGLEGAVIENTRAITIYRIVQELLNNSIKHAAASQAIVQLSKSADNISITVEDDGKGFDTAVLKSAKGMGWSNIQNRVEFLKGKMDVKSSAEKGTSVFIEITA